MSCDDHFGNPRMLAELRDLRACKMEGKMAACSSKFISKRSWHLTILIVVLALYL